MGELAPAHGILPGPERLFELFIGTLAICRLCSHAAEDEQDQSGALHPSIFPRTEYSVSTIRREEYRSQERKAEGSDRETMGVRAGRPRPDTRAELLEAK